MTRLRLHSKLYRARSIDQAMEATRETSRRFVRRREGQHHIVVPEGRVEPGDAEILAEICDMALLFTVEMERR